MRIVCLLVLCVLVTSCGGWHPLYEDPPLDTTNATYTATIDQGTVTPTTGGAVLNSLVTFTATPPTGFDVETYTLNGGTPVTCALANPSADGGDAVMVAIPITLAMTTVTFQTQAVPTTTTQSVRLPHGRG